MNVIVTLTQAWFHAVFFNIVEPCILSSEESRFPYLIRILNRLGSTVGTGSLIRVDKVLSSCTPFYDLPINVQSQNWTMVGYNFKQKCEQKKKPKHIIMAPVCGKITENGKGMPIIEDFALWRMVENFEIDENHSPLLWGSPHPPKLSYVESLIQLVSYNPETLKVGLFKSAESGSELQSDAQVEFIRFMECQKSTENLTFTPGFNLNKWSKCMDNDFLSRAFFCGQDSGIEWLSEAASPTIGFDWYSGAVVRMENVPGHKILPIGMLSRTVSNPGLKNFRILNGFHKGFYKFLKGSQIFPQEDDGSRHLMTKKPSTRNPTTDRFTKRSTRASYSRASHHTGGILILVLCVIRYHM